MQVSIRNFKRCSRADLAGEGIFLVSGHNNNGKSSVLEAVALAASGTALPPGILRKDAAAVVTDGAKEGAVQIKTDGGTIRVGWPSADVYSDGASPPSGSPMAVGLVSLVGMKPTEVEQWLGTVIPTEPTRQDLYDAIADVFPDGGAPTAAAAWEKIQEQGWDAVHEQARERGIKLKGKWEEITGRSRWGKNVGDEWLPEGWDEEKHAKLTIDGVEEHLARLRADLGKVASGRAVTDAMRERYLKESEGLDAAAEKLASLEEEYRETITRLTELNKEREGLAEDSSGANVPCPHCGGAIHLKKVKGGVELVAAEAANEESEKEKKARRVRLAEIDGDISNLRGKTQRLNSEIRGAQLAVDKGRSAKEALEREASGDDGEERRIKAAIAETERDLLMVASVARAREVHQRIMLNASLIEILGPSGLRRTALVRKVAEFCRAHLDPISDAAGWPRVAIEADLTISVGGRPVALSGESETWIARTILQIAAANVDGSEIVVIDGADVLDKSNRNALFGILMEREGTAFVGMTMQKPANMPDLDAAGAGVSIWMEDGRAKPRAEALPADK